MSGVTTETTDVEDTKETGSIAEGTTRELQGTTDIIRESNGQAMERRINRIRMRRSEC